MSKVDSIKFEIERLCRAYPSASRKKQSRIEREIDTYRSDRYLRYTNYDTWRLPDTDYHRVEMKNDSLDYIFTRIKLLSGSPAAVTQ